jgi:hypothetical protein
MGVFGLLLYFSNSFRNFNGSVILEDVTMSWQTLAK